MAKKKAKKAAKKTKKKAAKKRLPQACALVADLVREQAKSQIQIAMQVGIRSQTLNAIVRGLCEPREDTLQKIAAALGYRFEWRVVKGGDEWPPRTMGEAIRTARTEAGLTQTDLGVLAGRLQTHISQWELDENQPSWSHLGAILSYCGCALRMRFVTLDESGLPQAARRRRPVRRG
ncbi:MAG: helix-turn-helix transcriptional regulator [Planctomycetota bacterium]